MGVQLTCIILPVVIMLVLIGDGVHILLELALIPLWIAFGCGTWAAPPTCLPL